VAELRIRELAAGTTGRRRVEVTWQDGAARRLAVNEVDGTPGNGDGERIRWYLEDYAEFPAPPAPAIARDAETRLAQAGVELFRHVFAGTDAAGIWERARDRLGEVRVEVDSDPDAGPGLAWELLRDPGRDAPVALAANAFVRTHLRAAGHPELPEPAGDRLRVLLVICRPGGRADVPFRSVASRLVRGGADQMAGLDLEVLRPATFGRLSEVLHAAHTAGQPYHVVHFDGHGTWADLAGLAGVDLSPHKYLAPVRPGKHGYLLFEDPDSEHNQQFVDGPTLGRLLTETGVPVLVLNACRSAYAEAASAPEDELAQDVHERIKAYGSLAAEIADTGVPGVVAMRYNVYVVTAAQYMADLYAHLLAGSSLGQAATAARRALAADPVKQIGQSAVSLQDWVVPLVYEAAPLVLLRPPERDVPLIRLTDSHAADGELPRPPDAGFFGRDETLLALDRAFDTQRAVLLHAYAGAGKSSTAAEFARWYQTTGGLGQGAVLWSSFEHHLSAGRAIDMVGDHFARLLEANGIAWQTITDARQRRDLVMQVLAQIPVLWVWDNVEPVTGFPAGTPSAWTQAEQQELADLLRDLTQRTRCKILLTSRRDEDAWLRDLAARVWLPAMPMRESLQLAAALAARHGAGRAGTDWRPLLRYAAGNPLTITVLVGQALRESLISSGEVEDFVTRLKTGEARLEADEDAALGRTRSLAASLDYGFAHAFTDAERAQLAVLHLFRDTVDVDALRLMGDIDDGVPELAGLTREAGIALLDRAADIGLLGALGGGYYQIHPALPWYFASLFAATYEAEGEPAAARMTNAYVVAIAVMGEYYNDRAEEGRRTQVVTLLRTEEANLLNALSLARANGLWPAVTSCIRGLGVLYRQTGRDSEWGRLVTGVYPAVTDPATGGPLAGREEQWAALASYRARIAEAARDWTTCNALRTTVLDWHRARAAEALASPLAALTDVQRNTIRGLCVALSDLGHALYWQSRSQCLSHFQEALTLDQKIGDLTAESSDAVDLGNAYMDIPAIRDLEKAEHWFQHSLSLKLESDSYGRAYALGSLGGVALARFDDARAAGEAETVLLKHLNDGIIYYRQSLELTPDDDHLTRGAAENQLGNAYSRAGYASRALHHYQRSIRHKEARGDIYGAGQTRYNIAGLLARANRNDALLYARAALGNFRAVGAGAAAVAHMAERLIAELESERTEGLPPGARRIPEGVPRSLGAYVAHHVLDAGVVLEAVHGQVLAIAGVLEATVWHLGDDRDVGVDPHRAEVQAAGHPHRATVVLGPDAGGQTVLDAVRPANRLVLVGEPLHGDDRAEDLVLDHLVVLLEAGHDGRLEEETAVALPVPAGLDGGVRRDPVQETGHAGQLVRVVQRAVVGILDIQAAGDRAAGLLRQRRGQVGRYAGTGNHPGRRGAVLAGVEIAGARDAFGRRGYVGVIEDDYRGLATQLQVHALEVVRGRPGDFHAGPHRAGDGHHGRDLVRDQLTAGVPVAADHVEHARRQELRGDLRHQQGGRRGGVGRLEHDRVAGRDRGRELPYRHHHRVIPRRDLGAHADRLAPDHRRVVAHVLAGAAALEQPRGAGEEPDLVHGGRNLLGAGQRDRLAGVAAFGLDQVFCPAFERVGDPQQRQAPLRRRAVPPALERVRRRFERGIHILGAGHRRLGVGLPRARIDHIAGTAFACVGVLAVHEVLQGHRVRPPSPWDPLRRASQS
jgi:tetratricopeptide (TPR) repeat protein